MATNRQRYMISVDDEMRKEIEDFRFDKRFNTMSEATQELIRLGLKEYQKLLKAERPFKIPDGFSHIVEEPMVAEEPVEYKSDKED